MRKKSVAAAAAAALVFGGAQAKSRDPGPSDHRQVAPGSFDRIAVAGPFLVRVHTGKAISVALSGPRTMLDDTELGVRDGELIIRWQEGASWSRNGNQGVDIDITMPVIRGATNFEAGSIDIDRVQADRFTATLAGAGGITVHAMQANALEATLTGAGGMHTTGRVDTADLIIVGSGSFDNPGLTARDASIVSGGSGTVRTTVTGAADVQLFGSGGVVLTGGAKCSVSGMSSGTLRCS